MKLLAVVPAKYDSKRLPGKNRQLIGGKSLVQHTIDYLLVCREAGMDMEVVLVTNSGKMLEHAEGFDAVLVTAARGRAVLDVQQVVNQDDLEAGFEAVGMFLPTSPLRKVGYLERCMNYLEHGYDGAITVSPFDFPPQLAITGYGKDKLDLHFPVHYAVEDTRTQDHEMHYRPNGMCYVTKMHYFFESGNFFSGKVRGVLVPSRDMVDIDYPEDLEEARRRMKRWSIV